MLIVTLVCAVCVGVAVLFHYQLDADARRMDRAWLDRQRIALERGTADGMEFYCTLDTDNLLARLQGAPNVRWLHFQTQDLTAEGIGRIRSFPDLRDLKLYCCRKIDDKALETLAGHERIERLELTNLRVTGARLNVLRELPNLAHVRLSYDTIHSPELTDVSLGELIPCAKVKELELQGEWANEAEIATFKQARPDCEVRSAPLYRSPDAK